MVLSQRHEFSRNTAARVIFAGVIALFWSRRAVETGGPSLVSWKYCLNVYMMMTGLPSAAHADPGPGTLQWYLAVAMAWLAYLWT